MTIQLKPIHAIAAAIVAALLVGIIVGELLSGGGDALAAQRHSSTRTTARTVLIHACVNKRTHALRVVLRCGKGETALVWNQRGRTGGKGAKGPRGATGSPGAAATEAVGSVSTGVPGSQASVTNVGTSSNAIWNITIPQGEPGANGSNGTSSGPTAYGQIWMGSDSVGIAPGTSHNIVGAGSSGVGGAVVDVQGCSSAGLAEPIVEVTADHDLNDGLSGHGTGADASAFVSGWSAEPGTTILVVDVDTTDVSDGQTADSDFSISVLC